MKDSSDQSKTNVCKEEVLMCIFKDVPTFMSEEKEESSWVGGSHHEVVVGRQGTSSSLGGRDALPATDSSQGGAKKRTAIEPHRKKSKKYLPVRESIIELQLQSSLLESDELIPGIYKKSQKSRKKKDSSQDYQWVMKIKASLDAKPSVESETKIQEIYTNMSELCEDCQLFVGPNKSSTLLFTLAEQDGVTRSWPQLKDQNEKSCATSTEFEHTDSLETAYMQNYNKHQVMKLLNEVQSSLLECNILLTTYKLHQKVRKNRANEDLDAETPSNSDVLFDQIQAEEESTEGASKLCLALGRLVTKYLKIH